MKRVLKHWESWNTIQDINNAIYTAKTPDPVSLQALAVLGADAQPCTVPSSDMSQTNGERRIMLQQGSNPRKNHLNLFSKLRHNLSPIIAHFQKCCFKIYSLSTHKIKLLRVYIHCRNHVCLSWFGRLSSCADKYQPDDGGLQNFRET